MKRYAVIILAILLAVILDAFIFTILLGEPYSRVPTLYHLLDILALSCALTVLGDMVFKAGVLR